MSVQEIKVKMFRINIGDDYYDCITPLDNLGVITMVTDQNGDVVPFDKWTYFEEVISEHL
jgi:hypothetical protein